MPLNIHVGYVGCFLGFKILERCQKESGSVHLSSSTRISCCLDMKSVRSLPARLSNGAETPEMEERQEVLREEDTFSEPLPPGWERHFDESQSAWHLECGSYIEILYIYIGRYLLRPFRGL